MTVLEPPPYEGALTMEFVCWNIHIVNSHFSINIPVGKVYRLFCANKITILKRMISACYVFGTLYAYK